jgi:hypothetical protein
MTILNAVADLTAGTSFLRWYTITLNGSAIPTDTVVEATLVDTDDQAIESEILLTSKALTWNATGGTGGTGAWELQYTDQETRKLRENPNVATDNVKVQAAFIEIRVEAIGFPAYLDPVAIGRSHG